MKTPTASGSGRQGVTNSNSSNTNSFTTAPPAHQQSIVLPAGDGQELIATLAELFPAVFVADRWKPHKPLKIGIHQDLIDRGVLKGDECRLVLRRYCLRLMYRRSLATGGPRYGLDGEPTGAVTPEQMAGGRSVIAAIETKRDAKARAIADEKKADKATKLPAPSKAPRKVQPAPFVKPGRLGLADPKAAARARREAAHG